MNKAIGLKLNKVIGIGFFISIPIIFCLFLEADDHGLFLPRTDFIDTVIPDSFIYIKNKYELRCFEETLFGWAIIYCFIIGILNLFFWKNRNKQYFRIGHFFLTIGLMIIFFTTMVEDDIFHEVKIRTPIGRAEYEGKISVFYRLLPLWIIGQVVYFFVFFNDKISQGKPKT